MGVNIFLLLICVILLINLLHAQNKIKQSAGWLISRRKTGLQNLVAGYIYSFSIKQTPEADPEI